MNTIAVSFLAALNIPAAEAPAPVWEHLADLGYRFDSVVQGWGELGIDTCAHAPGQKPLSLRIKDERFERGLGHHAPGEISIDLAGEYDLFEAKVGVQWQEGNVGSVVFRVLVDGETKFESPVLRERDAAVPVKIPLEGAGELRLAVTDAGDGIACDCADWAEARLHRSASPSPRLAQEPFDVAPFARVLAWDPDRTDGARASRIEEFRAEDVFLGDEIARGPDGAWTLPVRPDGRVCAGLEWIERRRLRWVGIELAAGQASDPGKVEVQGWVGESPWQGGWKRIGGKVEAEGSRLVLRIDWKATPEARGGLRKVRWIFPADPGSPSHARFSAATACRFDPVDLRIEAAPLPGGSGRAPVEIEAYNGAFLDPKPATGSRIAWDAASPLRLRVRAARPMPASPDRTVLRLRTGSTAFGIAVDDIVARGAVYVPEAGILAVREPSDLTIARYRETIAGKKNVLEDVTGLPEQTLERALARTRNPIQDNGPMLLSLAADNEKIIAGRDGTIERGALRIVPRFGTGKARFAGRTLHGGWLPVPEVSFEEGGVAYRERAFVAPFERREPKSSLAWLDRLPLGVVELSVENKGTAPAEASIALDIFSDGPKGARADMGLRLLGSKATARAGGKLLADIDASEAGPLTIAAGPGSFSASGTISPGGRASIAVRIPLFDAAPDTDGRFPSAATALAATEEYWKSILDEAARIRVPDRLHDDLIRASRVHCLLAARSEADGARISAWIASMSYGPLESEAHSIIRGMGFLGHEEFARRSLDFFLHRVHERGYLTTGYTLLGTGWHLWTLGEHVELTGDLEWLRGAAPRLERMCRWIVDQRKKTMRSGLDGEPVPEYGLVPPGVIADWNAFAYHFSLSGYYCAGLREAARALATAGRPGAAEFLEESSRFRDDILRSWRRTRAISPVVPLGDGSWVPAYPSQVRCPGPTGQFFPGDDANRSWCYDVEVGAHQLVPLGLLDPSAPETAAMVDHMEDVQFLQDGWFDYPGEASRKDPFDLGGFSKVQPFYCRIAEIHAMRDDPKAYVRAYLNATASLLNTEVLSFWEHFHSAGAWNKTHETGYFLAQTRLLLAQERGEDLWLAPFAPRAWLEDGKETAAEGLPTRFGKVGFTIRSRAAGGSIESTVRPPDRSKPAAIVLRLRHPEGKPIRSVRAEGARAEADAARECIRLVPAGGEIRVLAEY
jgi:hypothetical protein